MTGHSDFPEAVAVIGMAGRFPGASDLTEFWENLCAGRETISRFSTTELAAGGVPPGLRDDDMYVAARGILGQADFFDAGYFALSPREAELTDPQHRIFLECTEEAMQDAGYDTQRLSEPVGVFAGCSRSTYLDVIYQHAPDVAADDTGARIGNEVDFLATRVAYKLNFTGPAIAVKTACSTGLVAIHLACQSLLDGECAMAVAGAACVQYPEQVGYLYRPGSISSPDGHCRAFDAAAAGIVSGNGCAAVVLKPLAQALADRDAIRAVVLGSAVNNDGSGRIGFTAPSARGQCAVIRLARAAAGVEPGSIGYVEAHGTGTPLGDPIEVEALIQSEGAAARTRPLLIGSVKANIGHLDAAAGVAGFIKAVLAVEQGLIPPTPHFTRCNPKCRLDGEALAVAAELTPWPDDGTPRRAGVSSFGLGGTNAHAVLQEWPAPASEPDQGWQLLPLSAGADSTLDRFRDVIAQYLTAQPDVPFGDVAFTLQAGRRQLGRRLAVVASHPADAARALAAMDQVTTVRGGPAATGVPAVAFSFPGQGTEFGGMARDLSAGFPSFSDYLSECLVSFAAHGVGQLEQFLLGRPETGSSVDTELAQPALFAVQYALAKVWLSLGVTPACMIGHSLGELTAAAVAGVFSLPDAVRIVAERGRLLQAAPPGAMRAVFAPAEQVRPLLPAGVSIAAINGPHATVVAGPPDSVDSAASILDRLGLRSRPLRTLRAFHTADTADAAMSFAAVVADCQLQPPAVPFLSTITGDWISDDEAIDPQYWAAQLHQPVRFAECAVRLLACGIDAVLEVGHGRTVSSLLADNAVDGTAPPAFVASLPGGSSGLPDPAALLHAAGQLWVAGVSLDWTVLHGKRAVQRVRLPVYPFERTRYSLYPARQAKPAASAAGPAGPVGQAGPAVADDWRSARRREPLPAHPRPELPTPYRAPATGMQRRLLEIVESVLGVAGIGVDDSFVALGGDSLMAVRVIGRIHSLYAVDLSAEAFFARPTVDGLQALLTAALEERVNAMDAAELLAFLGDLERGSDHD